MCVRVTSNVLGVVGYLLMKFNSKLQRSKEINVKPFYIYTNKTLDSILEYRPNTISDLLKVDGIGPNKAEEFGKEILDILND